MPQCLNRFIAGTETVILAPRGRWFASLSETLILAPADRNKLDIGTVHFPTSLTRTHQPTNLSLCFTDVG